MNLPDPFKYPDKPHQRRHGPEGYSEYGYYREWLRDEFSFRCVYCLRRGTWLALRKDHEIDHFLPKNENRDVEKDYDNLVFACRNCNGTKAAKYLPALDTVAYGDCLAVDGAGLITAKNELGERIIEILRLNGPDYNAMRKRIIETISENARGSKTLAWCLGYPDDPPDLSELRGKLKPKRNSRGNGIQQSCYQMKLRGELATYY